MRWLVDGYNVVRRDPELKAREAESLEAGRRALLHLLARARLAPQDEFTVVFDGARLSGGAPTAAGRIRVIFSRPPSTADDELMRLSRQLRNGAVVVSSDRKVQDAARRAGSAVLDLRSEEHTSELQSLRHLVCRLLLEKKNMVL